MPRVALAASERFALRALIPPRGLGALLGIVAIFGACWALTVPPFQTPDEPAHFAYSESLARGPGLPGVRGRAQISGEQNAAESASNAGAAAFNYPSSPVAWDRLAVGAYGQLERGRSRPSAADGGGPSSATQNPPLYYLYADVAYLIDDSGSTFGRLYGMRLSGVVLLLVTTVAAWLLAGEVFSRHRIPQLATATTAALLPMSTFMSTNVNADAGLIPTWTLALWLGVRVINHRARLPDTLGLCAATAAAILVKSTSYALVVPVLFALAVGWRRRVPGPARPAATRMVGSLALLGLPVLGWFALNSALDRQSINQIAAAHHPAGIGNFIDYLWQFYLPRLGSMNMVRALPRLPLDEIWIDQGAGVFGWLDVGMPSWWYTVAQVALGILFVAVVVFAVRLRSRRRWALLGFLGLVLLFLLGLLHVTEYRVLLSDGGQFLQGRYLLPAVSLIALAVGLVVSRVPRQLRAPACAIAVAGLLGAQLLSLATILHAYYL